MCNRILVFSSDKLIIVVPFFFFVNKPVLDIPANQILLIYIYIALAQWFSNRGPSTNLQGDLKMTVQNRLQKLTRQTLKNGSLVAWCVLAFSLTKMAFLD